MRMNFIFKKIMRFFDFKEEPSGLNLKNYAAILIYLLLGALVVYFLFGNPWSP